MSTSSVHLPTPTNVDLAPALDIAVEKCSGEWTGANDGFICSGGQTDSVLAVTDYRIGQSTDLLHLNSMSAGQTDDLRVTVTLPKETSNTYQGSGSTIDMTLEATQPMTTSD